MGVLAAKKSAVTVAVLALAILGMIAANAEAQTPQLTCASKLTPCREELNLKSHSQECCKLLKDVVTNNSTCFCDIEILKDFGIDINQARKLAFNCEITDDLCNSTLAESPSGNPGPTGPLAIAGNGNNGAMQVGLLGMSGLFLIWWSILA